MLKGKNTTLKQSSQAAFNIKLKIYLTMQILCLPNINMKTTNFSNKRFKILAEKFVS